MMSMLFRVFLILVAISLTVHADAVRVSGSATLARALPSAAPAIKAQGGAEMRFETQAGSSGALQAVGHGAADMALVTREIKQEDRAEFPSRRLFDLVIGVQVLVPIVSRETWDAGVKSIKKDDFVAIYEGDLRNWKSLGGEDRAVKFYNPEAGQGA